MYRPVSPFVPETSSFFWKESMDLVVGMGCRCRNKSWKNELAAATPSPQQSPSPWSVLRSFAALDAFEQAHDHQ